MPREPSQPFGQVASVPRFFTLSATVLPFQRWVYARPRALSITSDSGPPATSTNASWTGLGGLPSRRKISIRSLSGCVTQTSPGRLDVADVVRAARELRRRHDAAAARVHDDEPQGRPVRREDEPAPFVGRRHAVVVAAAVVPPRREAADPRDPPGARLDQDDRARPPRGNEQAAERRREPEVVEADACLAVRNRDRRGHGLRAQDRGARGERQEETAHANRTHL